MPMFYFDVLERDGTMTRDQVGAELDSADQAFASASMALVEIVQETALRHPDFEVEITIRDGNGNRLGNRRATFTQRDE